MNKRLARIPTTIPTSNPIIRQADRVTRNGTRSLSDKKHYMTHRTKRNVNSGKSLSSIKEMPLSNPIITQADRVTRNGTRPLWQKKPKRWTKGWPVTSAKSHYQTGWQTRMVLQFTIWQKNHEGWPVSPPPKSHYQTGW